MKVKEVGLHKRCQYGNAVGAASTGSASKHEGDAIGHDHWGGGVCCDRLHKVWKQVFPTLVEVGRWLPLVD